MTERIYYHDSYLTNFSAKVIKKQKDNDYFGLVFDKTAFYPTSGGQPHDQGTVNEVPIVNIVDLHNGQILHLLKKDIKEANIDCVINWSTRFDHMQQHSGQHILSQAFLKVTGATTIGFHLSSDYSTIDLDIASVSDPDLEKVEHLANCIVYENRSVDMRIIEQEDILSLDLRKKTDRSGPIRVIEIKEFDLSPCGGTHVKNTAEIGGIFVKNIEKISRGVRIEFLCGQRIIESYRNDLSFLESIAGQLCISPEEAPTRIEIQIDELKQLRKQVHTMNLHHANDVARKLCNEAFLLETIIDFQPGERDRLNNKEHFEELLRKTKVVMHLFSNETCSLKEIAQEIMKKEKFTIVLLACESKNSQIVFSGPSFINFQFILDGCFQIIGGKGGGSKTFVQAGGCNPKTLSKGLDLASNLVVDLFLKHFG